MLATFVIGLREGLEAALIVGIIAAFLGRSGRRDLLRWVMVGVAGAVVLCAGVGVALYAVSEDLPQRQQEGLETIIGAVAVVMVTSMVIWMKRHSRNLKRELEDVAGGALARGSAFALVVMAFLAVLREGFETAVFLVATFNGGTARAAGSAGALLGIAVAVGLGYAIYRGGVQINLARFFRGTGVVLVLVAAGLVQTALRTAHEAGWLDIGQQPTVDLSGIVRPGSVQSALLTGMLGIQPQPRLIELVGWLVYLVPAVLYVLWRGQPGRRAVGAFAGVTAAAAALVIAVTLSTSPQVHPGPGEEVVAQPAVASTSRTVEVTLSHSGCAPKAAAYLAGALTFHVTNTDATGATEVELRSGGRIIAEKENLPPGFDGTFALRLDAGSYTIGCPGTDHPESPLIITGVGAGSGRSGDSDTAALFAQGARDYAGYITAQTGLLAAHVQPLQQAIDAGNLLAAQTAYAQARTYYERIEPVAESFTAGGDNLDSDIDARDGDVPADQWRGFHVIEQGLWQRGSTAGLAPVAARLTADIAKLQKLVTGLTYQPAEIANGAVSLLDEVARNKVTGEEERYSHIDLLDFAANVDGAREAFTVLEPGLAKVDPNAAGMIASRFQAMDNALAPYRSAAQPSGFVPYTALTSSQVTTLSQAVQALQEPLSTVAGTVAAAG